jgi:hypothetical protein
MGCLRRSPVNSFSDANGSFSKEEEEEVVACRGEGSAVGPLLAARALPLRCAASTVLSSALLAIYLTKIPAAVIRLRIDVCVGIIALRNS